MLFATCTLALALVAAARPVNNPAALAAAQAQSASLAATKFDAENYHISYKGSDAGLALGTLYGDTNSAALFVVKPEEKPARDSRWDFKVNQDGDIRLMGTEKCLKVRDVENGAVVYLWPCNETEVRWRVSEEGVSLSGTPYCMDLKDGNPDNVVQVWRCAEKNPHQAWAYEEPSDQ